MRLANSHDLSRERGSPGISLASSRRDRAALTPRRPLKRSELPVQTCARVSLGLGGVSRVRGAPAPASAGPPTPTCADAQKAGLAAGRQHNHRYLRASTDSCRTTQAPEPSLQFQRLSRPSFPFVSSWARARWSKGCVIAHPTRPCRPALRRGAHLPYPGARTEGAAHALALSPAWCTRGAARPIGIAPLPGAGLRGLRLRASTLTGSRRKRAPRTGPPRPRGLRAASPAPPRPAPRGPGGERPREAERGRRSQAGAPRESAVTQTPSTLSAQPPVRAPGARPCAAGAERVSPDPRPLASTSVAPPP